MIQTDFSHLQAIDIYMTVCLAFVFTGLLEFAYVNVLTRTEKKKPVKSVYQVERGAQNGCVHTIKDGDDGDDDTSYREREVYI